MAREVFNYEKYLNFEETPFMVEPNENGVDYNIVVGTLMADFTNPLDKAGAQVLRDIKFHINPRATKNKWEVVGYGKNIEESDLNNYQRCKLEILKRQMPNFFEKYKEASPQQFALFARKLLRPMRDCHCKNNFKEIEASLFQYV